MMMLKITINGWRVKMDLEDLRLGMKVYTYSYGDMNHYDKITGYNVYEVEKIKENVVVLKHVNANQCFEVHEDDLFEYEEYNDSLLPSIKQVIVDDCSLIGYEDAMFRYKNDNIYQLQGVIKAINELMEAKSNSTL